MLSRNKRNDRTAIIVGAGPAGLTAAYELLKRTDIKPIIIEKLPVVGGISRTINRNGYRMDIGGHRFFTKSKRVLDFWFKILPLQGKPTKEDVILNQPTPELSAGGPDPEKCDEVMLSRRRSSRIYFSGKLFEYPVSLSFDLLKKLGLKKTSRIISSYLKSSFFPRRIEKSLEDFYINRFGQELYSTFFKEYTEKLWGVPCSKIKPDWGRQRVKGLSVYSVITNALKKSAHIKRNVETSLIEKFYYPKFGPGQLWERVAGEIVDMGGKIHLNSEIIGVRSGRAKIESVEFKNKSGKKTIKGDFFFSTMPVKDLINGFREKAPRSVKRIAQNLVYRDFITVGLLVEKLNIKNGSRQSKLNQGLIKDNWLYIQDPNVKLGRIQIFNNWSPYLLKYQNKVWIGIEYFCTEGDDFWLKTDGKISNFAKSELIKLGFSSSDALASIVIRQQKAYPAYFGSYDQFDTIKEFLEDYKNLFLIGRNGMHKYNNMDHSALTAMTAVDNIINNRKDRTNLWNLSAEDSYQEEKSR